MKPPVFSRRRFLMAVAAFGKNLLEGGRALAQSITLRRVYCPILMYHYIDYPPADADALRQDLTVTPELFAEHLTALQSSGYTTITMAQLWGALSKGDKLPPKPVILSFDDGYDNAHQYAFPRLAERGMVGTFFIVENFMGQTGYLTWEQVREMQQGGMEIGNHSTTHPDMSKLDYAAQLNEAEQAAAAIAEQLGARPKFFCYPFGKYNADTIRVVRETGHLAAVTTADGTLKYTPKRYEMPRVRVRNTTGAASLVWLLDRFV
jgi:peptidoglycan/xylan/chitin deacetylase (PgdA/CDA1 family)